MKKLIATLVIGTALISTSLAGTATDTTNGGKKNTPILNADMEQLFKEGRLGEVVKESPAYTSVDSLIDGILLETSKPKRKK